MQTGPVSLLSPSCHPGRPGVCRTRNVTGRDSRRQALPARHLSPSGAEAAFQAPVSAGAPPPAVGPGQSRAPPRLPGHPAHTSVSSCATRKVTVGRKVPSGLSLPTRHPRPLPAPDCRAEAGRGATCAGAHAPGTGTPAAALSPACSPRLPAVRHRRLHKLRDPPPPWNNSL